MVLSPGLIGNFCIILRQKNMIRLFRLFSRKRITVVSNIVSSQTLPCPDEPRGSTRLLRGRGFTTGLGKLVQARLKLASRPAPNSRITSVLPWECATMLTPKLFPTGCLLTVLSDLSKTSDIKYKIISLTVDRREYTLLRDNRGKNGESEMFTIIGNGLLRPCYNSKNEGGKTL